MMFKRSFVLLAIVVGLAAGDSRAPPTSFAQNANAPPMGVNFCQGCRSMVSFAQTFKSPANRSEYKGMFETFCELYFPMRPNHQQGPCPLIVEGLYYALDRTDPVHHCDQIGACGLVTTDLKPLRIALNGVHDHVALPSRGANVVCEFCEQLVDQTKAALSDPAVVDMVRKQAGELCDFLRVVDLDKECKQEVNQNLDQAIEFIKNLKPLDYCRSVQLCSATSRSSSRRLGNNHAGNMATSNQFTLRRQHQQRPNLADFYNFGLETSVVVGNSPSKQTTFDEPMEQRVKRGPHCAICKTLVAEAFKFLHQNKTEANIEHALDKICGLIYSPGDERNQCQSIVNAYARELVSMLADETDPELICMLLDQCTYVQNNKALPAVVSTTKPRNSPNSDSVGKFSQLISELDPSAPLDSMKTCVECKLFVRYLRDTLENPKSEEQLRQWLLANLCGEMPEKRIQESCTEAITTYSEVLFKALAGSLDPQAACVEMHACNKRKFTPVFVVDNSPAPLQAPKAAPLGSQTCDQCMSIVTQIDQYAASHPIDDDVSVLIDQVCNKMPEGSLKNNCIFLVKTFGAQIAQAISTMDNPRQFCSKIYLC